MNRKNLLKILMGFTLFFAIAACNSNNIDPLLQTEKKVLVINQGNFTEHSASVSIYDEESGEIVNRAFESSNGRSIGATVVSGSITQEGVTLLICNYPDKIEFIEGWSGRAVVPPLIEGLATPRNAITIANKLYVTNWDYNYEETESGWWIYPDSYVAIYDLSTMELLNKVKVGTDAEGILFLGGSLYVATREGVAIYEITGSDLSLNQVIKPQDITGGAKHLVVDKNFMIWASFPDYGVVKIDPSSKSVLSTVAVPLDPIEAYITTDGKGERIYTYNTTFDDSYMPVEAKIHSIDIATGSVTTLFTGTYFNGVGVNPFTDKVYTAEVSFTSNSVMKMISPEGELLNSATAGIGTSKYLFYLLQQ